MTRRRNPPTRVGRYTLHHGGEVRRLGIVAWLLAELRARLGWPVW